MPDRAPDGNLFALPPRGSTEEAIDTLARSDEVLVERIVSEGQATPAGSWLEGGRDEWVVLLAGDAELAYPDGLRVVLRPGDHVLIPAGARHRVERTSAEPAAVWLAVHAPALRKERT